MRRRNAVAAVLGAVCQPTALRAPAAFAQAAGWVPDRPIRIIYPYPPGGGGDAVARLAAERMREDLGQPVLVENRPGAAGLVGMEYVVRAPKDGYTILVGAAAIAIAPSVRPKLGFDPVRDLAPIALLSLLPVMLSVRADSPVRSVADLVALARSRNGGVSYATFGIGSPPHLVGERIAQEAGAPLVHVPYQGSAPGIAALRGGTVDCAILDALATIPQINGGALRGIAVASRRRMDLLPDVPTLTEAGVPHDVETWHAAFGPPGMPEPAVQRLNAAFVRALDTPDAKARLVAAGVTPVDPPLSAAEWSVRFAADVAAWRRVAQRAAIVVE